MERVAGTFQDRLLSELRLAGANSLEEANYVKRYLPRRHWPELHDLFDRLRKAQGAV